MQIAELRLGSTVVIVVNDVWLSTNAIPQQLWSLATEQPLPGLALRHVLCMTIKIFRGSGLREKIFVLENRGKLLIIDDDNCLLFH